MDAPDTVIGTSNFTNNNVSYRTQEGDLNNPDLFEYDQSGKQNGSALKQGTVFAARKDLRIPRAFYFFFFAAFGSLSPLMAIYFKQMAFSSTQVGILFGFRPFVEFLSVPFWANCAERWRRVKTILIFSISCWILFTLGVGFIQPPVHSCLMNNGSHIFFEKKSLIHQPNRHNTIGKRQYFGPYLDEIILSNNDNNQMNFEPFTGLLIRKKKQIVSTTQAYLIQNVTNLNSISIENTSTMESSLSMDELQFRYSFKNNEKKSNPDSVNNSIEAVKNDVTLEVLQGSKPNQKYKKTNSSLIEQVIESTTNDLVNKNLQIKSTSKKTTSKYSSLEKTTLNHNQKTLHITTTPSRIILFPMIDFNILDSRPSAHKHPFFESPSLDSSQFYGRTIYMNGSMLKLIKPMLKTSIVYEKKDVNHIFLVFLIFILAGEFFSAPAITMADTCTLQYLGPANADQYEKQRMFGSLGWGLAMLTMGILLDNAHDFTNHPCGKAGPDERNYSVCFAIYSILMTVALLIATQFHYEYEGDEQIPLKSLPTQLKSTVNQLRGKKHTQYDKQKLVNESDDENDEPSVHVNPLADDPIESSAFSQETTCQKYKRLIKLCRLKHMVFIYMVVCMGVGGGLVFTFLFWHLQDLGGTPTLYGIASIVNHLSELIAYFFVHEIVAKYGHVKVFYWGLAGNTVRFLYVSLLSKPYWILPFEFIQGITHALVWGASSSYFAQSVPNDLRSTAQGMLQGLHFGLGRGIGAVFGGFLISIFGAKLTFFFYGFICLLTLFLMMGVKRFNIGLNNNQNQNQQRQNESEKLNENENVEFKVTDDVVVNVVNPLMQDTNYYYQSSNSNVDPKATAQLRLFVAPHGAPSTNPNWTSQFKNL